MRAKQAQELPEEYEIAISALLSCRTIAEAATAANVSESTLYRLKQNTAFREMYHQRRRAILEGAQARLVAAVTDAVNTLITIANDPDAPKSVRVTAAVQIIDQAAKAGEALDLNARMSGCDLPW